MSVPYRPKDLDDCDCKASACAGWLLAIALGVVCGLQFVYYNKLQDHLREVEWDKEYWKSELMRTYEPQQEVLLDGQCCNPQGEGCDEYIYGEDC